MNGRSTADAASSLFQTRSLAHYRPIVNAAGRRQVVWNILSNAVTFTSQNGRMTVTMGEQPRGDSLDVTDNGRGISPNFLPFIF